MRLQAMLVGMQTAFKYASKILSPALDGLRSVYAMNSVDEIASLINGVNRYPLIQTLATNVTCYINQCPINSTGVK